MSSTYLKIYEDYDNLSHGGNRYIREEGTTELLISIPLGSATLNKCTAHLGIFRRNKKNGLTLNSSTSASYTGIDLLFDTANEHELSVWENAILEAQEMLRNNANRLIQARNEISLLESVNNPSSNRNKILRTKSSESAEIVLRNRAKSAEIGM